MRLIIRNIHNENKTLDYTFNSTTGLYSVSKYIRGYEVSFAKLTLKDFEILMKDYKHSN